MKHAHFFWTSANEYSVGDATLGSRGEVVIVERVQERVVNDLDTAEDLGLPLGTYQVVGCRPATPEEAHRAEVEHAQRFAEQRQAIKAQQEADERQREEGLAGLRAADEWEQNRREQERTAATALHHWLTEHGLQLEALHQFPTWGEEPDDYLGLSRVSGASEWNNTLALFRTPSGLPVGRARTYIIGSRAALAELEAEENSPAQLAQVQQLLEKATEVAS